MRSFSCEEDYIYENIENELYFFTSQVGCGGTRDMGQGCGDAGMWACRTGTWGKECMSSPPPQVKKGIREPQPSWGSIQPSPKLGQGGSGEGTGRWQGLGTQVWQERGRGPGGGTIARVSIPLRCHRNGKTSSGTGWRTCAPSRASRCTTSTSSRGSPSVSTARHGVARHGTATPLPRPVPMPCHGGSGGHKPGEGPLSPRVPIPGAVCRAGWWVRGVCAVLWPGSAVAGHRAPNVPRSPQIRPPHCPCSKPRHTRAI